MSTEAPLERAARRPGRIPWLVRGVAATGVTPDGLSYLGFLCAVGAAIAFAVGAGHALPIANEAGPASLLPFTAAVLLGISGLADVLDGDLARFTGRSSPFGGILDSTLDRLSDALVLVGAALHFTVIGNATMVAVTLVAFTWAMVISYVKARAEALTDGLGVGFWQRSERWAALLCGAMFGHVAAALWLLATLPGLTAWRRFSLARRKILGLDVPPSRAWAVWRARRGSPAYLAMVLVIAAFLWLAPRVHPLLAGTADPLGGWLRLAGP